MSQAIHRMTVPATKFTSVAAMGRAVVHGRRPVHGLLETHQEASHDGQAGSAAALGRTRRRTAVRRPRRGETAQATAAIVSTLPEDADPGDRRLAAGTDPEPVHEQSAQGLARDMATVNNATPSRPMVNDWANTKRAPIPPATT